MRIAIAGKGGAGKSFITGTLARFLAQSGERVVILDSDPMPGVALSLGMGPVSDDMLAEAVEKGDDDRWRLKKGIGPARAILRYSREGPDGVRLLQYGKSSEEGLGPIMGSLNGFTRVVHRLATDDVLEGWTILGDLPAGPRQTAFNWAPYATRYLVVAEPTWQSVMTARRVMRLAGNRIQEPVILIANKVREPADLEFITERLGVAPTASIPWDRAVVHADREGASLVDLDPTAPAAAAVRRLAEDLSRGAIHESTGRLKASRHVGSGGRP